MAAPRRLALVLATTLLSIIAGSVAFGLVVFLLVEALDALGDGTVRAVVPLVGVSSVLFGVAAAVAAAGLWRGRAWAWTAAQSKSKIVLPS